MIRSSVTQRIIQPFLSHIIALFVCVVGAQYSAEAQFVEVPPLTARVVDKTGILGPVSRELESTLRALETEKGSQVAVLVVPTTKPETIEQYGIRVVDQWKLGRKGIDDGALLLVALEDRAVRIEVGRGLEGDLPDAIAKRIISEQILPHFRGGDVPGGIRAGVASVVARIKGMELPPPAQEGGGVGDSLVVSFFVALILGVFVSASFGNIVGAIVSFGFGSVAAAVSAPLLVAIPFGLACGALVFFLRPTFVQGGGSHYGSGRGRTGSDSFGMGGRSGGFSGGGFSGGGGGFGGGGASGRW